jgi:hypothetical protein
LIDRACTRPGQLLAKDGVHAALPLNSPQAREYGGHDRHREVGFARIARAHVAGVAVAVIGHIEALGRESVGQLAA